MDNSFLRGWEKIELVYPDIFPAQFCFLIAMWCFPIFLLRTAIFAFFSRKGRLRSQREQGGRAAFEGEKRQKWQFKAEKWENITLKWENRIKQEKCLDKPTRFFLNRVGNYVIHPKTRDIVLYPWQAGFIAISAKIVMKWKNKPEMNAGTDTRE